MKLIYGDFETYYDKEYTPKKMTTYEYILDSRWETIGCGIVEGNSAFTSFFEGDTVAGLLREYPRPWAFVSYNALFDASILAYRYNIHPDMLIDAMGIVRATLQHKIKNGRVNLANVAKVLGLPDKGGDAIIPGFHLADHKRIGNMEKLKDYCLNDTLLCRSVTQKLAPQFPKRELWVMSTILKMCTKPNFWSDNAQLSEHLFNVVNNKEQLLQRIGLTRGDLLSNDKFVEALKKLNVNPPTKISPSTGKEVYACDKQSLNYLLEDDNPDVQALVAARIGVKSTLEETRTQRFININASSIVAFGKPLMPVALKYGAAHTHRFGGEWKVNMQNLPVRKNMKLRNSLIARPGRVILAVDAAQIQCRLTAWIAGETDLLDQFRSGIDVYSWFGSDLFKQKITKQTHPVERFIAKENVLGLGFQMGATKLLFHLTSKAAEYELDIKFTLGQCEVWVNYYRHKFRKIKQLWYYTDKMLEGIIADKIPYAPIGPSHMDRTDLVLPTGLRLYYDNLRNLGREKVFDYGRETKKIYGGKFTENHVQALDRCHVMDVAYRIEQRQREVGLSVPLAHQVHDELIYVPHKSQVATLGVIAYEEMITPAWWGTGLPLDAEVKIGPSYGELKPVKIGDLK